MVDSGMTLEELIVLMSYKAQNIKAHLSSHTFECVVDALQQLKEIQDTQEKAAIGFRQEKQNSDF